MLPLGNEFLALAAHPVRHASLRNVWKSSVAESNSPSGRTTPC